MTALHEDRPPDRRARVSDQNETLAALRQQWENLRNNAAVFRDAIPFVENLFARAEAAERERDELRHKLTVAEIGLGFPIVSMHIKRHETLASENAALQARVAALEVGLKEAEDLLRGAMCITHGGASAHPYRETCPTCVMQDSVSRALRALLAAAAPQEKP